MSNILDDIDKIEKRNRVFIGNIEKEILNKFNPNNIFFQVDKDNFNDWKKIMIENKIVKNPNIAFLKYGYYRKHLDNTIIDIIVMNDNGHKNQANVLSNDLENIYKLKRVVYIICNYPYKNYFWDKNGLSISIKYKSIIRGIFSVNNLVNSYSKIDHWEKNGNIGNVWNISPDKYIKFSLPLNSSIEIINTDVK